MQAPVLCMRNITKVFPGCVALDNVSFEVRSGEIAALVGENGAGKSTLMKILSGVYPSDSYQGEVFVAAEKKDFRGPKDSEDAGIAMIYQEVSVHLDLSVAENLVLGNWPAKRGGRINWRKVHENAEQMLRLVGFDVNPRESMRNLSTSQQQLVCIARALSKQPRILVLDEPTAALTKQETETLFRLVNDLKSKGIAIILISHRLDEVFQHADTITVLRDGHIVASHRKTDVTPAQVVAEMVGRRLASSYPKECAEIGEAVLEVEGLTVQHPFSANKNIVEDISFSLRRGEILGIAGLVGSGRSELVGAIFGRIPKATGRVFIKGKLAELRGPADSIRCGICLVTEDRRADGLVSILDVKKNISLASLKEISPNGVIRGKYERDRVGYFFKRFNIKAPSIDTLVESLSGGNQQKVVLAKWLMRKPSILIMDEPTRGIDVGAKYDIYEAMVALAKEGVAIIMISSEFQELVAMADRLLILSNGRFKAEFAREACTVEEIMRLAASADDAELARSKTSFS